MSNPLYSEITNESKQEIRLIQLMPGSGDDPIECRMETILLKHGPDYEALSYVWGSSNDTLEIKVNQMARHVTENLFKALLQLRYPHQERALWVDAICINQNDISERSAQVSIMGDIFISARRVLVWLGESTKDTAEDILLLRQIASTAGHWYGETRPDLEPSEEELVLHKEDTTSGGTWCIFHQREGTPRACHKIFSRSWWKRLWTVQELVLAFDATFVLGNCSISWKALQRVLRRYENAAYHSGSEHHGLTLSVPRNFADLQRRKDKRERLPLLSIVQIFTEHEGHDPKDYLYAFRAISSDSHVFEPEYGKETRAVFIEFAEHYLSSLPSANLNILSMAGCHIDPSIPSWAPEEQYFTQKRHPALLSGLDDRSRLFTATQDTAPKACIENSVLIAEGWVIATFGDMGQEAPLETPMDYMLVLQDWEQVVFRRYGDSGTCSDRTCSSQLYYKDDTFNFAKEACKMSVSCVLDHWNRRNETAQAAWPSETEHIPESLWEGEFSHPPIAPKVQQTPITDNRKARLAKVLSPKGDYVDGVNYFPTNTSIGEAFCRTIFTDTFRSWRANVRVDEAIETSRYRKGDSPAIIPSKESSYANFMAAFVDSYIPKWDFAEAERIARIPCLICCRWESRQVHTAANFILLSKSLEKAIAGRRFIMTKSGLMGLAPGGTRQGDIVVLLKGCNVPMILRSVDESHQTLIGECYVHGIMDGYLMKGFDQMKHWERTFRIK